jgi:excisionase family DNA binding protein
MEKADTLEPRFVSEKTAARYLGLSHRTLQNMRVNGGGPGFHKFGRRIQYDFQDLDAWAESRRYFSTSEYVFNGQGDQYEIK